MAMPLGADTSLKIRRKECDSNFRGASKPVHGSANRNAIGAPGFFSIQKPEGRPDITPTYCIRRGQRNATRFPA
jgi:hypothetical protein